MLPFNIKKFRGSKLWSKLEAIRHQKEKKTLNISRKP